MITREQYLDFARKEASELDARMAAMRSEYDLLHSQRTSLGVILGEGLEVQRTPETPAEQHTPTSAEVEIEAGVITEAARNFIQHTTEKGFKPKDVAQALLDLSYKVSGGFASNLLFRMKKKKEVVECKGRYYLPMNAPDNAQPIRIGNVETERRAVTEYDPLSRI